MTEYLEAWQCIGCGKVEAPQTCIGVCSDRRVELVYAAEHEGVLAQLRAAQQRIRAADALLRTLASTTPRDGEWKRGYCALQEHARRLLLTAISV